MIMSNGAILNSASNVTLGGGNTGSDGVLTITDTAALTTGNLSVTGGTSSFTQSGDSVVTAGNLTIGAGDSYDLQGGTLRVNNIANSGTFTWGDATITSRQAQQNADNGTSDYSSAGFNVVQVGTNIDINTSLTATGAKSTLDLNSLYISNGVRFDQFTVTGTLSLTGTDDTLDATINPYLLRPNIGTATESGSLPLVSATTLTGVFETEPTFLQDNIGWNEFTGAFTTADALPTNSYFLEYTADSLILHYKVEGTVPEPGTLGLLVAGVVFLRAARRKQRMSTDA